MSTEIEKGHLSNSHVGVKKVKPFTIPKSTNPVKEDGISSCFHNVKTSMYVSLAPSHTTDPINGIKAQHLDPLIMTYFHKAEGVVLAYYNIKLNPDNISQDTEGKGITIAKVSNSSPFTFLWIEVDLLIWKPQLGDVLEGFIYLQTPSHIGLLVHDTFNASIKKFNIPSSWIFHPNQEDELSEDRNSGHLKSFGYWADHNDNKIEGKLKFTVKSIHTTGRVVSLEGTLIEPGSEKDAQPIRVNSNSSRIDTTLPAAAGTHKKFDDEPMVTEIPEPAENVTDNIPKYSNDSEDEAEGSTTTSSSESS